MYSTVTFGMAMERERLSMTVFCLDSHPIWRNVVIIYCNARVLFLGGAYIQRDNNAYAICKNFTSTHARNLAPQHFEVHFEDIYSLKMFKDTLLEKPKNTLPKSVIFFLSNCSCSILSGHRCREVTGVFLGSKKNNQNRQPATPMKQFITFSNEAMQKTNRVVSGI